MKSTKRLLSLLLALVTLCSVITTPATAASQKTNVKITTNGQIVDTLNGVPAKYEKGTGNSNSNEYCCAQYVKNYYKSNFNISVYNLTNNCTPKVSEKGYEFKKISSASEVAVGDVVRLPHHWAIVKEKSGNVITLIEQNWKWADKQGNTYATINRTVTFGSSDLVIFRLYKDGKSANGSTPSVVYESHLADIGWTPSVSNGAMSGTTGEARRMEAIKISLKNLSGGISYCAHVQDEGWQSMVSDGSIAGSTGLSRRLEAIKIELTGQAAQKYSIWYRVHVQDIGWMEWCKDGAIAGTEGRSLRIEAIEIKLVAK